MRQLTGMDASFLHVEAGGMVGHVSSLILVDPSSAAGPINADTIRDYIASRIHLIPPLRWRLVEVPFGIDLPYWVDDPELDLDNHVHGSGLPRPGTDRQLAALLNRLASRPLDRAHPLWEIYVIEGLESGHVGIFTKLHHSAIDGASGMQILATLLDFDPGGREIAPPQKRTAERIPSDAEMVGRGWLGVLSHPEAGARLAVNMARESVGLSRLVTSKAERSAVRSMTRTAPKTVFNQQLSKRRSCAFATLSLPTVRAIKTALECTVNDVVLAICAGALRRWLLAHDELPGEPLLAMVPISIRSSKAKGDMGNQVTATTAQLATQLADPLDWVKVAHESMNIGKAVNEAVPAALLQEFGQFAAPAAAEFVARTFANLRVVNRVSMPFNVVVSNVPGPRETLYYAGAEMLAIYPVSMISDGVGLNITVHSYRDGLDFGLISTPEIVPDIWELMDCFQESLDELTEAAGVVVVAAPERAAKAVAEPAGKTATKRTATKRTATKRTATKRTATKRVGTKAAAATKTAVKETAVKKTAVKKTAVKRAPARKATDGKRPAAE